MSYSSLPQNPPDLVDLFLDNNMLMGMVPEILPNQLQELNELTLQANELTGEMPDSICALRDSSLESLFADCAGDPPEIICPVPTCCTACF